MNRLIQKIEEIQGKLEGFRRHSLNETSTRTKIINPLLEALGWDVGDPDEVEEEYTTFDGKSVDYALKINGKPVLLVEAKAINDPLNDNKAIGQVVGYAANAGIVWCVLTNGVKWQVYRSVKECPAPEKLMFEVSLDPQEAVGKSTQQLAEQMWGFSREGMELGRLEDQAEETFTEIKVRKALDSVMRDPPKGFIKILKVATNDESLKNQKIKESLSRIWAERPVGPPGTIDMFNNQPLAFWKKTAGKYTAFLILTNQEAQLTDEKILNLVQKRFPGNKSFSNTGSIRWMRQVLKGDYPSTPCPKYAQGLKVPAQVGGPPEKSRKAPVKKPRSSTI